MRDPKLPEGNDASNDIVFSTPPSSFLSVGLKFAQYGFGLPAPGSGAVITSPAS